MVVFFVFDIGFVTLILRVLKKIFSFYEFLLLIMVPDSILVRLWQSWQFH